MKISTITTAIFFVCAQAMGAMGAGDPPKGFENPELLARILKGEIVIETVIDTKLERKAYLRAYFLKSDPKAYMGVATNHPLYPTLFEEIVEARTVKVNDAKTEFDWYLDMIFAVGPLTLHAYPEGRQILKLAAEPTDESLVDNTITNYKDLVEFATQRTRLIPYEDGMLVEDEVHLKMLQDNSKTQAVKKQLTKQFTRFIEGFRVHLNAVP